MGPRFSKNMEDSFNGVNIMLQSAEDMSHKKITGVILKQNEKF